MAETTRQGVTIAAVASPPGPSTAAIIRLSGQEAIDAAEAVLTPPGTLRAARPATSIAAVLALPALPAAVRAVVFRAPRSYTGEDLVELVLPGSTPLVAAALEALLAGPCPVRLARPGEFTFRAFRSGRIDLSQAEAVAGLIGAASEAEARAAGRQLRGELRERVEGVSGGIVAVLGLMEAALDFPDEDIPAIRPASLAGRLDGVLGALDSLRRVSALRLPDGGALRAALAGFPNAGKSSLLNVLLGRPAAIVADLAGTTRDPVRGIARGPAAADGRIEWIDLAGFELSPVLPSSSSEEPSPEGEDPVRAAVARLTREALETADVVVWVVDGSDGARKSRSLDAFEALAARRKVLAVSKGDLLDPVKKDGWRSLPSRPVLVSSLERTGLADLARAVEGGGDDLEEPPQFLVTARQAAAAARARGCLAAARFAVLSGAGLELVAVDLREALLSLEEITGREVGERVLDAVFSRFCIGK